MPGRTIGVQEGSLFVALTLENETIGAEPENLLFADYQTTGTAHNAVGFNLGISQVRAGIATAYPHPNQFISRPILRSVTRRFSLRA
jgi:hypothetical protein